MNPADFMSLLAIAAALSGLALLASSRLDACLRIAAFQGVMVSLLPLSPQVHLDIHVLAVCAVSLLVKALAFPVLIGRTLRRVKVRLEVEPYLGYPVVVLLGVAGLMGALWLSTQTGFGLPVEARQPVAAGFFLVWTGLLVIVSRKKAISQVIGYLIAENGIFVLSCALNPAGSLAVELCILLDVLVAIFVMGIAIHHINRQFDSIDTERFCSIRD
ncbi:hydrogenase [Fundidesulfovibrio butyratiphilus]